MEHDNIVFELKNIDVETCPEQKLREMIKHLQGKMNETYVYLVGEWNNAHRARSTRDGQFVSSDEVRKYLT